MHERSPLTQKRDKFPGEHDTCVSPSHQPYQAWAGAACTGYIDCFACEVAASGKCFPGDIGIQGDVI